MLLLAFILAPLNLGSREHVYIYTARSNSVGVPWNEETADHSSLALKEIGVDVGRTDLS